MAGKAMRELDIGLEVSAVGINYAATITGVLLPVSASSILYMDGS